MPSKEWDIFISHASEDKIDVVKPIAEFLNSIGANVWYDAFTLELGDSLSRSIDKGLANSRFGLVVLSPAFFDKDWPEYEFRGLVAKELGRDKVILPIWHNVEREDVMSFSPSLADKLAVKTADNSTEEIALKVLAIVRPDLLENIHSRIAFQQAVEKGERKTIEAKKLKPAPIRHKELPNDLVRQIRLIRAALIIPYPQTMEFWLDGFKRDMHPHKEIEFWEHVAASYLEYIAITSLTPDQHKVAFSYISSVLNGLDEKEIKKHSAKLPEDSIEILYNSCRSRMPVYELSGLPNSIDELMEMQEDELEKLKKTYEPQNT